MNKLFVSGNIGKDAEMKEAMANNRKYITFPLANTEKINGAEHTTWFQCFVHNESIVNSSLINYLKKGNKVLIIGRSTAEIFNRQDGNNVISHSLTVHNIELMGSSSNHQPVEQMAGATPPGSSSKKGEPNLDVQNDDDLPF